MIIYIFIFIIIFLAYLVVAFSKKIWPFHPSISTSKTDDSDEVANPNQISWFSVVWATSDPNIVVSLVAPDTDGTINVNNLNSVLGEYNLSYREQQNGNKKIITPTVMPGNEVKGNLETIPLFIRNKKYSTLSKYTFQRPVEQLSTNVFGVGVSSWKADGTVSDKDVVINTQNGSFPANLPSITTFSSI